MRNFLLRVLAFALVNGFIYLLLVVTFWDFDIAAGMKALRMGHRFALTFLWIFPNGLLAVAMLLETPGPEENNDN